MIYTLFVHNSIKVAKALNPFKDWQIDSEGISCTYKEINPLK